MTLAISEKVKVRVVMRYYVTNILDSVREKHLGVAVTSSLFEADESSPPLDKDVSQVFHTLTTKILFLSKRSKPVILTVVAFLTTRVRAPINEDDHKITRTI